MVVAAAGVASKAKIAVDIVVGAASEATAVGKLATVAEADLGGIEGVIGVRGVENVATVDVEEAGLGVTVGVATANVVVAAANVVVETETVAAKTETVGAVVRGFSK